MNSLGLIKLQDNVSKQLSRLTFSKMLWLNASLVLKDIFLKYFFFLLEY